MTEKLDHPKSSILYIQFHLKNIMEIHYIVHSFDVKIFVY